MAKYQRWNEAKKKLLIGQEGEAKCSDLDISDKKLINMLKTLATNRKEVMKQS